MFFFELGHFWIILTKTKKLPMCVVASRLIIWISSKDVNILYFAIKWDLPLAIYSTCIEVGFNFGIKRWKRLKMLGKLFVTS